MNKEMTVREFRRKYKAGRFNSRNVDVQIEAGWYDWFCKDSTLLRRLKRIWRVLKGVKSDYILDNYRVWFRNKCPIDYQLYDEINFSPIESSDQDAVGFGVSINDLDTDYRYAIFTERNDLNYEAGFDRLTDVWKFINNWENALRDENFYREKKKRDRETRNILNNTLNELQELLDRTEQLLAETEE